jgi:hypothetical protein
VIDHITSFRAVSVTGAGSNPTWVIRIPPLIRPYINNASVHGPVTHPSLYSTMASRPLPGASYHTADLAFHSCSDVDLEAVDSYASEKGRVPFQTSQQGNARLRRGPPVMLILLLLCCLSFVASAYVGRASADQFIMPLFCVPERHAPRAAQLSAAFRTSPNKEWVYGTQEKALDILKQKYNSSRVGCHAANVRDYMRQTHSVVESSLEWADVSESAIVLHWQGSDSKLKPVIIANTDGLSHSHSPP